MTIALVVLCILQLLVLALLWRVFRQQQVVTKQSGSVFAIVGGAYAEARETIRQLKGTAMRAQLDKLGVGVTVKPRAKE